MADRSRSLAHDVRRCLGQVGATHVGGRAALLTRRPRPELVELLVAELGLASLRPAVLDGDLGRLHLDLLVAGPYDVVVDLAGGRAGERLAALVYHLRAGGVWVLDPPADRSELEGVVAEIEAARAAGAAAPLPGGRGDDRSTRARNVAALASSVRFPEVGGRLVAAVSGRDALAKIADPDSARLSEWDPTYEVLATLPAGRVERRAAFASSRPSPVNPFPTAYDAPAMTLRSLREVTCTPGQIAHKRNVVLPESFNRPGRRRLRSKSQLDWADRFILPPTLPPASTGPAAALRHLGGAHFHLDSLYQGHFGHAVAEQTSRLWGWAEARGALGPLKVLIMDPRGRIDDWQYALLASAGVAADDVVVAQEPVVVEQLVSASALFSRPDYVHEHFAPFYRGLGDRLATRSTGRVWPERVFLSRRPTRRVCLDADRVEALHRAHGFQVVLPEELSLADQVQLVRRADVVSGYAGSNMFQIAFADAPLHVIAIAPSSYPVHNEYLFSAAHGHRLDLVLATPEVARPEDHFSSAAFQSDYHLDDTADRFLTEVLQSV